MKGVVDFAVVYDISSDAERAKIDHMLKGFGFRVQKSVFECRLDRKGRGELLAKLKGLEIKTGFVKVYRLEYQSRHEVVGAQSEDDIDGGHAFVV